MSKAIHRRLQALEKSLPKEDARPLKHIIFLSVGGGWTDAGERLPYDTLSGVSVWRLADPDPYRNARHYGISDPWLEEGEDPRAEYTLIDGELRKPRSDE